MLKNYLEQHKISSYRLAKISGVPYSTLSNILLGHTNSSGISLETAKKLAVALNLSLDDFYDVCRYKFQIANFENFKSEMCHSLKRKGDIGMICEILEKKTIERYMNLNMTEYGLYVLGMLNFLLRKNALPQCEEYAKYMPKEIKNLIFPDNAYIEMTAFPAQKNEIIDRYIKNAEKEFIKVGIVEGELYNVR